jgi:hypothetical protein
MSCFPTIASDIELSGYRNREGEGHVRCYMRSPNATLLPGLALAHSFLALYRPVTSPFPFLRFAVGPRFSHNKICNLDRILIQPWTFWIYPSVRFLLRTFRRLDSTSVVRLNPTQTHAVYGPRPYLRMKFYSIYLWAYFDCSVQLVLHLPLPPVAPCKKRAVSKF